MKKQYWSTIMVLIGALLIGACSTKDKPHVASSSSSQQVNGSVAGKDLGELPESNDTQSVAPTSPLDNVEALAAGTNTLPSIAGIDGGLLVVGDETLVYARFDGEPATIIHEEMNPFTVEVLPNQRAVFIGRQSDGRRGDSVFVYNLETFEFVAEYPLNTGGTILGWSDDGAWLSIGLFQNNMQVIVVSTDGSFRSEAISNGFDVAWMTDNTAISIARDPDNNFAAFALRHYDPITDIVADLDIPITEDLNLNVSTYEVELAALGYTISDNYLFFDRMDETESGRWFIALPEQLATTSQVICASWQIMRFSRVDGTHEIIHTVEDTHRLTDINLLPDGSALVIRWFREGCSISDPLQAELLRITPQDDAQVMVDNILVDSNGIQNLGEVRRYTLSSDGRFVVWVSQDGGTLQNPGLDMIDLETGSRLHLYTRAEGDNSVVRSVTWVE